MADELARRARVTRLVEAARVLADARSEPGSALRRRLLDTTGLSAANIELGLERCLETTPNAPALDQLLSWTPEAPVAHVLLSGNVFVAALRAIVLGVAASERTYVRASRRDPALADALHRLAPGLFELVPELRPAVGHRLWAYGADETLRAVRATLPRGVWFHRHGAGFGAVVVEPGTFGEREADQVVLDATLFDQRGCLSPRVVYVRGDEQQARQVGALLGRQLSRRAVEVPLGPRSAEERADMRRQRDAAAYAFELFDADESWVSVGARFALPPAGRNLHVVPHAEPVGELQAWAAHLTTVATHDEDERARLRLALPGARVVALGEMQRPPLDGPVDLRHGTQGELV